jgi:succinoglycan biosynthesis protein ExoM
MLVSICIITYQRPEGLKQLINKLDRLEFKDIDPPRIELL